MTSNGYFKKICKCINSYEYSDEFKKGKKVIEKELQALKIIKNKKIDVLLLFLCFKQGGLNDYNKFYLKIRNLTDSPKNSLTNKEFELLKDVLKK